MSEETSLDETAAGTAIANTSDLKTPLPGSYAFLALVMLLNVLNFVDRQLISSFANFIVPDLKLSESQFGLLTGLIFIFFYAVMGLFTGYLADRMHRPRLVAAGVFVWSVLTAATGAAKGFVSIALPRMFIGVGESVLTPASMSMLADRFPLSKLGLASGIYYMGVPIGAGLSLLVAGYLGPAIGWRTCFFLIGAIGVLFAVVMLFVKETPRRGSVAVKQNSVEKPAKPIALLLTTLGKYPSLGLTIAGGVAAHFILGAAVFDQLWYVQELGFERAEIARLNGYIFVVFGIAGNFVGGMGSDIFQRVTGQGRPMFLFWLGLVMLPLGLIYRLSTGDSPWFWIGMAAGIFQLGAFYGPSFSTVQELAPPQARATVVAFYLLCLNLIGLGIGVTAAGYVLEWMREAGWAQPFSKTLLAFTAASALSIPLFLFAGLRYRKDRARIEQEAESS